MSDDDAELIAECRDLIATLEDPRRHRGVLDAGKLARWLRRVLAALDGTAARPAPAAPRVVAGPEPEPIGAVFLGQTDVTAETLSAPRPLHVDPKTGRPYPMLNARAFHALPAESQALYRWSVAAQRYCYHGEALP